MKGEVITKGFCKKHMIEMIVFVMALAVVA